MKARDPEAINETETRKAKKREETRIQRLIQATFGADPDIDILRNNNGQAVYDNGSRVVYGLGVGTPDLVIMLQLGPALCAWVALEVKIPGEEPTPDQLTEHAKWRKRGVQVFVVHSLEEARAALEIARGVARSEVYHAAAQQAGEGVPQRVAS